MAYRKRKNPADLPAKLAFVGLSATAASFNDFIARATKGRWSPVQMLEELARSEIADHTKRSFERRLAQARLGRFKPLADFDWNWPTTIDRPLIEQGNATRPTSAASGWPSTAVRICFALTR